MGDSIRIVGQGIAGSMLASACERAGIEFEIFDQGHEQSASRVGAGLVSPLAGRRLVPTWRFKEWRDEALQIYREWEHTLGQPLVREMKIRRFYRNAAQRELFEARCAISEVAEWVTDRDADGLWMRGAIQVETGSLIQALRERWQRQGRLKEQRFHVDQSDDGIPTIWCLGAESGTVLPITWQPSRGEIVSGQMEGLDPGSVLNDGHWLLPQSSGEVKVGSTFDRENLRLEITPEHQSELRAAAERLAGRTLQNARGDVGLRVTVIDHRPVVGWCDSHRQRGLLSGLAAKGALWAPVLAEQWVADRLKGEFVDAEARVGRFSP